MPTFFKILPFGRFGTEFLSVFSAVILAFMLNSWNDGRKADLAEEKILKEVFYGLGKDSLDVQANIRGHKTGIQGCEYWLSHLNGNGAGGDTLAIFYQHVIFRDYISIQNTSGYEALKSRGLELVEDDSLRNAIVSLYEYDYEVIKLFEEEYQEMQYFRNYFPLFQEALTPYMDLDSMGQVTNVRRFEGLDEDSRKRITNALFQIKHNREFVLEYYEVVAKNIQELSELIGHHLEELH